MENVKYANKGELILKMICGLINMFYESLLNYLDRLSLEKRRLRVDLMLIFKIIGGFNNLDITENGTQK